MRRSKQLELQLKAKCIRFNITLLEGILEGRQSKEKDVDSFAISHSDTLWCSSMPTVWSMGMMGPVSHLGLVGKPKLF